MANESGTPVLKPSTDELENKPFFKKLRFWVHLVVTVFFLALGQYKALKNEEGSKPPPQHASEPAEPLPAPGSPTVWSLQVQATGLHETLKAEIEDRKILSANVEEYRRENHNDLNALSTEVKGLRDEVRELVQLERARPKSVSLLDLKTNTSKE